MSRDVDAAEARVARRERRIVESQARERGRPLRSDEQVRPSQQPIHGAAPRRGLEIEAVDRHALVEAAIPRAAIALERIARRRLDPVDRRTPLAQARASRGTGQVQGDAHHAQSLEQLHATLAIRWKRKYMASLLPPSIRVIVRGWLNCNQVVLLAPRDNVLVDSGYCTHRERTLELLASRDGLDRQPLERLVNTHCHSDHMGGNAAVANAYGCRITIPSGEVQH